MKRKLLLVEAMAIGNDSGLGRHVRLFVESLVALLEDAEVRVVLPWGVAWRPPPGIQVLRVPGRPYRFFCEFIWLGLIAGLRPRVALCLGQSLPGRRRKGTRYVLLVPDAGPLEDLPFLASRHQAFNRNWMRRRIPQADCVITSAEFTRRRLSALLGINPERITLVPPVRRYSPPASGGMGGTVPSGPYFLAVGNVEPRKNFPNLLRAYALLAARVANAPPLHILGHAAWDDGVTAALRIALGLEERVHLHGHVSEGEREDFLRGCAVFVSSSLYEGFGLPLFEALRAGKACIYHGGSAQGEFAAGFALAADCALPESLAEVWEIAWRDGELRRDLGRRAREDFPARWEKYDVGAVLGNALRPLLV